MHKETYRITEYISTMPNGDTKSSRRFTDRLVARADAEAWIRGLNPDHWRIWGCYDQYLIVAASGRAPGAGPDSYVSIMAALYAGIGDEVREFLHWHLGGVSEYFAGR